MVVLATRRLTFRDFQDQSPEGRYELVDGRMERLVSPSLRHGWADVRLKSALDQFLEGYDPEGYWGSEVDIPTLPLHGRRPGFLYYSAAAATRGIDLTADRVLAIPTLAVEIVSDGDRNRDTVTKRREYALAGIPHYWIIDPHLRTAITLTLRGSEYVVEGEFAMGESLTSSLLPGFALPLRRLFR